MSWSSVFSVVRLVWLLRLQASRVLCAVNMYLAASIVFVGLCTCSTFLRFRRYHVMRFVYIAVPDYMSGCDRLESLKYYGIPKESCVSPN
jgi:hypothetical protein